VSKIALPSVLTVSFRSLKRLTRPAKQGFGIDRSILDSIANAGSAEVPRQPDGIA